MSNMNETDPRDSMTMRREERKWETDKARAEAFQKTMEKTIAAALKDPASRKNIARDAMRANQDHGGIDRLIKKSGEGAYDDDGEIITGREPKPWDR
jgi:hypothetical protein